MKIYSLQSHPIQYFAPLFKAIADKSFCEFKVYYCTDSSIKGYIDQGFKGTVKWDIPLLEGYHHQFLKNYSPWPGTHLKIYNLINPGIISVILKDKPDVLLIHGWAYLTNWLAIFTCKFTGTKIWMKCENPLNQERQKSKLILFLKKIILGFFLFKLIDKFLYIGEENKAFYSFYKVPENKLLFSPYAVDNERFAAAYQALKNQKYNLRKSLKIPENSVLILYSGKLIAKKRPLDLLEAFLRLKNPELFLVYLGDGELRLSIEQTVQKENIQNVMITGFVNQLDIPKYYAMADIFVLPSTIGETWGLVVNEAMNFGLPVIVSDMAGCANDLVEADSNGYTYPVGNIPALSSRLQELSSSFEKREKFGNASLHKIKSYSYDSTVTEIKNYATHY